MSPEPPVRPGVRQITYSDYLIVEQIIGLRMGTGGSSGASYLKGTLDKKFFPELWEARSLMSEGTG